MMSASTNLVDYSCLSVRELKGDMLRNSREYVVLV